MSNRNTILDILKGLAIILVVLGHVIQFGRPNNYISHPLYNIIYSFHMPLFILISGFLAHFSIKDKKPLTIVKKKFLQLIVPFFAWVCISYGFYSIISLLQNGHILSLIGYVSQNVKNPACGLWFLWVLFFLYILLLISLKIKEYLGRLSYLIVYIALMVIPYNKYFDLYMIKWMFPLFLMGYLLSSYNIEISKIPLLLQIVATVTYIILMNFWSERYLISEKIFDYEMLILLFDFTYRYMTAITGIIFLTLIVKLIVNKANIYSYITNLGTYTLDIYALHIYFLIVLSFLPQSLISNFFIFNILYVPTITLFIALLSCLVSKYTIRRSKSLRQLFIGGR